MSIAISGPTTSATNLQSREREIPAPIENAPTPLPTDAWGEKGNSSSPGQKDQVTLSREAQAIRELQTRDREVRAHEAAHAAIGGSHAGSPTYTYRKGPDGRSYAVGGEVQVDTSKVPGDPQATLEKAETIRAAALAPAQPSSADRAIAARATAMAAEARAEMAAEAEKEAAHLLAGQYPGSGRTNETLSGSVMNKFA